jgi:hypothetical protein
MLLHLVAQISWRYTNLVFLFCRTPMRFVATPCEMLSLHIISTPASSAGVETLPSLMLTRFLRINSSEYSQTFHIANSYAFMFMVVSCHTILFLSQSSLINWAGDVWYLSPIHINICDAVVPEPEGEILPVHGPAGVLRIPH